MTQTALSDLRAALEREVAHFTHERDEAFAKVRAAEERLARFERDMRRHMGDNLTATQKRCTELLLEVRALRAAASTPVSPPGAH